jgi:hypothetical protein
VNAREAERANQRLHVRGQGRLVAKTGFHFS